MGASYPGNTKFSYKKYYKFRNKVNKTLPERFTGDMRIDYVTAALLRGDTQPAVVCSTEPLLIAAYSDEMDGVVMLEFPDEFATLYELKKGSRLTTSNVYYQLNNNSCADDIFPGAGYSCQYGEFVPIVQLFIGKDDDKIREHVNLFGEDVWQKVEKLGDEYLEKHPGLKRNGFFYFKKQK